MKYRAFANGKEINNFYLGGQETSQIWGGNTLLWEKCKTNMYTYTYSWNSTYPSSNKVGPGIKTEYMDEWVCFYGLMCKFETNVRLGDYFSSPPYATLFSRNDDRTINFNIFIKASKVNTIDIYKFVSNSTTIHPEETYKRVRLNEYKMFQVEKDVYSLTGAYDTILFNDTGINGQYISAVLPNIYSGAVTIPKNFDDMNKLKAYLDAGVFS